MKTKVFIVGLGCLFILGCETMLPFYFLDYDILLSEVERPAEAKERYGEKKIFETDEGGYKYVFEDEMVKIFWLPTSSKIGFLLENKTEHSIRIIWDEAAYIDENGVTHRVMHSGVRYIERDSPQTPSVIVRRSKLTDIIFPTDYVIHETYTGWEEIPLLPNKQIGGDPQKFLEDSKEFIGKTIQVLLPIQIERVTSDYIFTFKIDDVKFKRK